MLGHSLGDVPDRAQQGQSGVSGNIAKKIEGGKLFGVRKGVLRAAGAGLRGITTGGLRVGAVLRIRPRSRRCAGKQNLRRICS